MDSILTGRADPQTPSPDRGNPPAGPLARNSSDLVYLYRVEPDPGFVRVSPSASRITGYSPEEFCADPDLLVRITHPHDEDLAAALLRAPRAFPEALVIRLIHRTGRVVWTEHTVSPISDSDSQVVAVEGIARDISDSVKAENELWKTVQTLRRTEQERRKLLSMLVHTEERERARLAADLHDDALQILSAALMRLDLLRRNRMADWAQGELEGIQGTVRHAVERLRSGIFDLLPPDLDCQGLPACLRRLLNRLASDTGIECSLDVRIEDALDVEISATLYRIALEALANVRKHARATRVTVQLEDRDDGYVMRIIDDGVGFREEPDAVTNGHFGLHGIRERARLLGGRVSVRTAQSAGTVLEVRVPRIGS